MRITILLLIVGLCIVSAKYLPYENESSVLLRNRRSNSEESSPSAERNNDSNNKEDDDDDDDDDNSKEQAFSKERRKEEEQRRKLEEKLAKEQRKQEEKREKEERKRLERIEKEKRKEEEKHKKILEKAEREEKKRQEKQRKELEKLEKEALIQNSNEDSFLETEEENSVELGSIWRNHIYIKYGLTLASTHAEKKAALDRYLKEELGLNSNSTQSERQQAIIKLIETRLQNDTASKEAIRNQLLNQINSITINKLRNKLDHNIEKLTNKTNTLNNVTLPWASITQQKLEEQKTFLQSVSQFLSNVLPNWATKAQNPISNSSLEQNVQGKNNEISLSESKVNIKSGINEISADKNVVSGQPSKLPLSGSSIVINNNSSDPNSNVAAETNIVPPQNSGAPDILPNSVISGQGNEIVIDEINNSPVRSLGDNNSSLKSGSSDVGPALSDVNIKSGINEISADKNVISGQPSKLPLSGSSIVINNNSSDPNSNVAAETNIVPPQNSGAPDILPNSVISGQGNEIVIDETNNSPVRSLGDNNSSLKSGSSDVGPALSDVNIKSGINEISADKNVVSGQPSKLSPSGSSIVINNNSSGSNSNVAAVTNIVPPQNSGAPDISPNNVISGQGNEIVIDETNNSPVRSLGDNNSSLKSGSSDVGPALSEVNIKSGINEISADKNVVSGQPSKLSPSGSSIVINNNSSGSNSNVASETIIVSAQNLGAPDLSPNNVISGQGNKIVIDETNNLPVRSLEDNNSSLKSGLSDVSPALSDAKLIGNNNKSVASANIGIDNASNVLGTRIDNTIVSNVDSVNESSAAPAILDESSVSSGQLSNNENVSAISVNDSNVSSVNSSNDANRNTDIISQSASDIILPSFSSVLSDSVQASASDVVSDISVTKNISAEPPSKEISVNAPVDANKDSKLASLPANIPDTVQPSLNVSSSNNVQTSESIANQGIESNITSKTNEESEVSSASNVSDSSLNKKVNSSTNVKTNNDINKESNLIPPEKLASLPSNNSSVDVLGVTYNNNTASEIASSDNKINLDNNNSNVQAPNVVNAVSQNTNSESSKLENAINDIIVNNENESNISGSNVNIESSLNNGTVNMSSTVDKISSYPSTLNDVALLEIDISTSTPSIVESTYDVVSSISSQNNDGNIGTTVNVIEIVTSSSVNSDISNSLNNKTYQVVNNDFVTDSSNISQVSPDVTPSVNVSSNNKIENNTLVNEAQSGNLSQNSSLLEAKNLVGNDSSTNNLANVGVTNETNIPNSDVSLNTSNDSTIINIIDGVTTVSSIDNKILLKTNESNSNAIASSTPVVIAESSTIDLSPEISTVVTTSADLSTTSTSSNNNISEIVTVADNSSATTGNENVMTTESNNLSSVQKVANESSTNVGIEASTEPFLVESTVIDLGAPSTLSEAVTNVNTASSDLVTESSLNEISSVQTDNSQSLSTTVPADSSTLAQVDGVTLPAELGASVVEILPQV